VHWKRCSTPSDTLLDRNYAHGKNQPNRPQSQGADMEHDTTEQSSYIKLEGPLRYAPTRERIVYCRILYFLTCFYLFLESLNDEAHFGLWCTLSFIIGKAQTVTSTLHLELIIITWNFTSPHWSDIAITPTLLKGHSLCASRCRFTLIRTVQCDSADQAGFWKCINCRSHFPIT